MERGGLGQSRGGAERGSGSFRGARPTGYLPPRLI